MNQGALLFKKSSTPFGVVSIFIVLFHGLGFDKLTHQPAAIERFDPCRGRGFDSQNLWNIDPETAVPMSEAISGGLNFSIALGAPDCYRG